jgi:hypothetical protein
MRLGIVPSLATWRPAYRGAFFFFLECCHPCVFGTGDACRHPCFYYLAALISTGGSRDTRTKAKRQLAENVVAVGAVRDPT